MDEIFRIIEQEVSDRDDQKGICIGIAEITGLHEYLAVMVLAQDLPYFI